MLNAGLYRGFILEATGFWHLDKLKIPLNLEYLSLLHSNLSMAGFKFPRAVF